MFYRLRQGGSHPLVLESTCAQLLNNIYLNFCRTIFSGQSPEFVYLVLFLVFSLIIVFTPFYYSLLEACNLKGE